MDSSTEEILLQKIEELIIDEDKIVTNSLVCEKLDLSITEAKHILDKYVSDESLNPGKISVTYLVCGKLKTGDYCIKIIDAVALKEQKKLFSSITNEVVYSVQKSNTVDFNTIALSEKSTESSVAKGNIVGEKCIERLIKTKVLPPPPPQKNFEKQKPSSFFKPVPKTEVDTEKKATQSSSSNGVKIQKKSSGLDGFLSQNKNENKQLSKKTPSSDEDTRETKRPRMETNGSQNEVEVKKENVKESCEIKKIEEKNEVKPASKNGVNKKKQEGKKRKRIIVQSDSEDDLFGNDDENMMDVDIEKEQNDVDVEEKKPVITQSKEIIPKNKRRKAVEKVYTDDEGFVVTKTEYVLVSASEDEESESKDEKPKVAAKPEQKEKKSPPKPAVKGKKGKTVATNQPTLMNFFKKK